MHIFILVLDYIINVDRFFIFDSFLFAFDLLKNRW